MADMTCRTFGERLDDLLEGRLSPADRRAADEHLRSCAGCRELKSLVAEASVPVTPPADLLGAVLARTSGSACGSARARLCDHIDRLLAPADDDLVRMHLDACGECAGLAARLARLAADLPPLAERDPGPRLVDEVLARTSRRPALPSRRAARFAAVWRRLAHRPRIAWEGAYVGSIIMVVLFGAANAPFADVPGRALVVVRAVQESLPADAARGEVPRIRLAVLSRWNAARALTSNLERRSSAAWDGLKKELGTVWGRFASGKATSGTNRTADTNEADRGDER